MNLGKKFIDELTKKLNSWTALKEKNILAARHGDAKSSPTANPEVM